MKNKIVHFVFLLIVCANCLGELQAQVNKKDSLALVDLYQFTKGNNWSFNNGWLTSAPVSTWAGITVVNNRVADISLSFNKLKGVLPPSISDLTAVRSFDLAFNTLTGRIPATIGKMKALADIDLQYNKLIGNIPSSITQLAHLESILLAHNLLYGSIPDSIHLLSNLNYINVSYNKLTGSIPASFGELPKLTEMNFTHNQLTGIIPSSLGNLKDMFFLDLSFNQLSGNIPTSLSNLKDLFDLYLNNNQLTGDVPRLTALFDINLNHNHLSQSENIPIAGPTDYTGLDLRYNSFNFNGLEYAAAKLPNAMYKFQEPLSIHIYNNKLAVSAGGTLSNNTYNWYRVGDAGVTVIKGDSTFVPNQNGQYYAMVTNAIANRLTLTTDTISYTASAEANTNTITLSVYPNPVKGLLTINGLNAKQNYRVMIADVSGYVWLNTPVKNQSTIRLSVSNYKPGNYIVNVYDGVQTKSLQFVKE